MPIPFHLPPFPEHLKQLPRVRPRNAWKCSLESAQEGQTSKGLLIFVREPMIPKGHGSKALPSSTSARAQTSKTPTVKTNTDEVLSLGTRSGRKQAFAGLAGRREHEQENGETGPHIRFPPFHHDGRADLRWIETSETVYNVRGFYPMPVSDAGLVKARRAFTKHRGMLRTSDAIRLGVHPRTLYTLRDRGEIEQVGRGLYRLSTAPPLTSPDLVSVAIRIPRAVICLISALAHHGLTTQVPHAVDVALPSHAQVPTIDGIPLRVFWYSEPSFSGGMEVISVDQVPVRVYSAEKTIADCFKYRNKIGLDVAIEALRTYRERTRKPDSQALSRFAQMDRVEKVMRPYLEATL